VVNDLVLDANGQKMSKSRGNTVDPRAVMERHGADAVRLFLMASSQVWVPRRFDEAVIRETAGRFLVTLRNVYSGIFAQYANFGWSPSAADPAPADRPVLDRWILSRLASVEAEVDAILTRFDATAAARVLMDFVSEDVANWYVRLSRSRFYETTGAGQPRGLRDVARGAGRHLPPARTLRALRERLDARRAHRRVGASGAVPAPAGGGRVADGRCGAGAGDGDGAHARDPRARGA
jgi:valyl-tRNA synthetase